MSTDPAVLLERARDELARLVSEQWKHEAGRRGLLRPEPLRVRWSSTGRPVAPTAAEVAGAAVAGRAVRLRLHGDVAAVAKAWRQLPARQLVVIGAAGAGKTSLAVLLVCQLLADQRAGDHVPVLLSLSGWDPRVEHLDTWLARRLAADYPQLTDRTRFGAGAPVRLIDRANILPVLDGLDEMPEELRPAAATALTDAIGSGRPVVLTCRAQEYENAIAATGTPLSRAAVVEIEPVTGAQAAAYLPAGQTSPQRWTPVVAHLRTHPDAALAAALATPLMVYLARTAYTPPHTDPTELLRFTSPDAIEAHLLEAYLPALYGPRAPARDDNPPLVLRDYSAEQAGRWLAFLARHLHQRDDHNLAWWRLLHAVRRPRLSYGFVVFLVFGLTFELMVWLTEGVADWVVVGLSSALFGLMVGATALQESRPTRIHLHPKKVVARILAVLELAEPLAETALVDPKLALQHHRTAILVRFLLFWLLAAPLLWLFSVLGPLIDEMLDRQPWVFTTEYFLTGWLTAGPFAFVLAGYESAWFKFTVARYWLGAREVLPLRLMRFLDDACRRGVLRQIGAEYQFRHVRLQDYLAARNREIR